tara:strand:- start:1 stop:381 length:381 start_codon:yes stop_codon:yes gene_type:complete
MLRQLTLIAAVLATPASATDILECNLQHSTDSERSSSYRAYYSDGVPYGIFLEDKRLGHLIPTLAVCMDMPDLRCIQDQRWLDGQLEIEQFPTYGIPLNVTTYTRLDNTNIPTIIQRWQVSDCEWK